MITLDELCKKNENAKGSIWHDYMPSYEKHLANLGREPKVILEIGVAMGGSMKVWHEYFPNAEIHGIDNRWDLFDEKWEVPGTKYHLGDQQDLAFLRKVLDSIGKPIDLIIDDGGHMMSQYFPSFEFLFPFLSSDGLYVIEDIAECRLDTHKKMAGDIIKNRFFNQIKYQEYYKGKEKEWLHWIKREI